MVIVTFTAVVARIVLITFRYGTIIPVVANATFVFIFTKNARLTRISTVAG